MPNCNGENSRPEVQNVREESSAFKLGGGPDQPLRLLQEASREEDTVTERFGGRGSVVIDPNDLSKSRAVAEDDRTHVVSSYFICEFPIGPGQRWVNHGWLAHVIGGWRLGGIGRWASGRPLVISGVTASNGVSTGLGAYANVVDNPELPSGEQQLDRWFNTAAFTQPAAFTFAPASEPTRRCVDRR